YTFPCTTLFRAATQVAPARSIATTTPTYTWNAVASATQYLLWVDDSSGGRIRTTYTAAQAGCAGGTGTCSITPSVELTPGAGQWWIVTINGSGNRPWSPRGAFTVAGTPPPGPVTLVGPPGGLATSPPRRSWDAVASAAQYLLWVDDSTGGRIRTTYTAAEAGCASGTGMCSLTPSVTLSPGAGQWWIVTSNASGNGPWSARGVFTLAVTPPPSAATLIAPAGSIATTTRIICTECPALRFFREQPCSDRLTAMRHRLSRWRTLRVTLHSEKTLMNREVQSHRSRGIADAPPGDPGNRGARTCRHAARCACSCGCLRSRCQWCWRSSPTPSSSRASPPRVSPTARRTRRRRPGRFRIPLRERGCRVSPDFPWSARRTSIPSSARRFAV